MQIHISSTFKPQNYLEILLSAHAWTLPANILHLDQKAGKCATRKWLYGFKFKLFIAHSTSLKMRSSANFQERMGSDNISFFFFFSIIFKAISIDDRKV